MDTQVRTPQLIFMQAQRLTVPLFQRPYVWNLENQWAPLWSDVARLAARVMASPSRTPSPHFLGAVVLQQAQNATGSMQERTVIDGQQRLTTLQLMLDALQAEVATVGADKAASRLEQLTANPDAFRNKPEDRFKVWPTNRDREAFNEVMAAPPPVHYAGLTHRASRLAQAHRFFAEQARLWLQEEGAGRAEERANAIEKAVRDLLQLVVIDLTAEENAQEIFETLNARGAQLTAADLIKNFIFQRLLETDGDVEMAYERNWKEFETGFWETEISFGRVRYSRSSVFLNHWLIAQTGEELVARELFSRFKRFADDEARVPMTGLLERLRKGAKTYRTFVDGVEEGLDPRDRLSLFAYRTSTLESEVFKPVILLLLDPDLTPVPQAQLRKALDSLESWLVRRMLVRETTKSYSQIAAELVTGLKGSDRMVAGDTVETFLRGHAVASRYWPDDNAIRSEVTDLLAYTRLRRRRLRMVLEAVEDHLRGWRGDSEGMGGQRVPRGKFAIEHILPRKWQMHWPLTDGVPEVERDQLVHTLGNLTLLTSRLNSKVSNGPWHGKRAALHEHDVLKLNARLLNDAGDQWTEAGIRQRTQEIIEAILAIWPVPEGHRSEFTGQGERSRQRIEVADLIGAGLLEPGTTLYPRRKKLTHRVATVLPDGRIDVDGVAYGSLSGAAAAIIGKNVNGWWFFLLSPTTRRSMTDLWHEYVDQTSADVDEADAPEEDDDG